MVISVYFKKVNFFFEFVEIAVPNILKISQNLKVFLGKL